MKFHKILCAVSIKDKIAVNEVSCLIDDEKRIY
jgi:hypothetical protein